MYSETETSAIALRLNTDFGLAIFTDLVGGEPKNGKPVRLLDNTPTTQDIFYLKGSLPFPHVHNYSSGITYTPIIAYAKVCGISNKDAFIALCNKYINNFEPANTPNRTYTPAIATQVAQIVPANPLEVAIKDFEDSISTRRKSNFVYFLRKTFNDAIVKQVLEMYDVGNTDYKSYDKDKKVWNSYDTAFWYRDANNKLLNAKYFIYDKENAKRSKTVAPNWLHYQKRKDKPAIGFFGEHLSVNNNQTIWIVESEKSAIIATIYFLLNRITNIVVWACGGLGSLKSAFENCSISKQELQKRKFLLVPDTDTTQTSFKNWNENLYVKHLANEDYDVSVSDYLENNCTDFQKEQKFDIADFFLSQYLELQELEKQNAIQGANETENNETSNLLVETPAIATPAISEITQLSYQSYSNLFKCFNENLNFGAKVDVFVYERCPIIDLQKLTTFFNSFDFGKSVEFNVCEVFDVLTEFEKTFKLIHKPTFTTTLQANGEITQITYK